MKKIVLLILTLVTLSMFSQKIKIDEVDEFTNKHRVKTSWVGLNKSMRAYTYWRFAKTDSIHILELKMMRGTGMVFAIRDGKQIHLLMSDGSVLDLDNIKYTVTSTGAGAIGLSGSRAMGLHLYLTLDEEDIETLRTEKIVKVRVNTTDGYVDDKVKEKRALKFIKMMNLIKQI